MTTEHTLLGVRGTLHTLTNRVGGFSTQEWTSEVREVGTGPQKLLLQVKVRYDDSCANGYNNFAVTGEGWYGRRKARDIDFGGCCHEEIAQLFPELAHLIKWHLMSSKGPTHYIANTVYLAGDRDHNGKRKGEPWAWAQGIQFGNSPVTVRLADSFAEWLKATKVEDLEIVEMPYTGKNGLKFSPKYSFKGFGNGEWHKAPFDSLREAEEFLEAMNLPHEFVTVPTLFSEGKERELDAARGAAIWPEATDDQLSLPPGQLTALLSERLPGLIAEFKADIESIGFQWEPTTTTNKE